LCKNNSKIYECSDNIQFICSDYLQVSNERIEADIVFLSPPWGGIDYKTSAHYSLKEWVTPDITKIIEKSLQLSKNLIFYLPRNTDIQELLGILNSFRNGDPEDEVIFMDVQWLKSAHKIKAQLIFFGPRYNKISLKDLRKYLHINYNEIKPFQMCQLLNICKVIGISEFISLREELIENGENLSTTFNQLFQFIKSKMSEEELIEFNNLEKLSKKGKNEVDGSNSKNSFNPNNPKDINYSSEIYNLLITNII
jgi:site-specific DNA-adenine methylase